MSLHIKRYLYRYVIPIALIASVILTTKIIFHQNTLKNELIHAVKHGSFFDIQNTLQKGANINVKNEAGQTPLHSIAYKGDPVRITFLLEKGANLHARDFKGGTPLHWAVINGRIKNVNALLDLGANPNAQDNKGATPLHWATNAMKINIPTKTVNITALLNKGANPSLKDVSGRTALDYARLKKIKPIINILERIEEKKIP